MKIDLFENKYKPSNAVKIFFADVVCFLLVAMITIGLCYAYLSDKADVSGTASTAKVAVEYQYNGAVSSEVYVKVNGGAVQALSSAQILPGDKITIVGSIVSQSNVSAYTLAKLEIVSIQSGEEVTETIWYNIGSNDPTFDANGEEIVDGVNNTTALDEEGYIELYTEELTVGGQTHTVYKVGAGSLGAYKTKDLAIPYTFDGETYKNGDTIVSVTLTLHAHQKDHLSSASDWDLYNQYAGQITGYDIESIYAVHYITGTQLKRT